MTGQPDHADARDRTSRDVGEASTIGTPRWVKVFAIVLGVVVLLLVVVALIGGGNHGPSRHTSMGEAPSASIVDLPGSRG